MTGQPLYRGVRVDLGSNKSRYDAADPQGKARILLDGLPVVGMHWSRSEDFAQDWATQFLSLAPPDRVHAVLTAEHPGQEYVQTDPTWLDEHGVANDQRGRPHREQEEPLLAGTPVRITAVSMWVPAGEVNGYIDPEDGDWMHVPMSARKTATYFMHDVNEPLIDTKDMTGFEDKASFDWIHPQIATGGALRRASDVRILARRGVTAIVSGRRDFEDSLLTDIPVLMLPSPDDGNPKPTSWFKAAIDFCLPRLRRGEKVYIHCHAGMNRGPSLAYAVLRAYTGWDHHHAMDAITSARSVALVGYAADADRALVELGYAAKTADVDTGVFHTLTGSKTAAVKTEPMPDQTSIGGHTIRGVRAVEDDGYEVGHLTWDKATGIITMVEVKEPWRRQGIATSLLAAARAVDPNVQHSTAQSADGKGWSSKTSARADWGPKEWGYYQEGFTIGQQVARTGGHLSSEVRARMGTHGDFAAGVREGLDSVTKTAAIPDLSGFKPPDTTSCNRRSDAFVRWCKRKGIKAERISLTDVHGGKADHSVVVVNGNTVVDWTYRQFDPAAPEPLIEPLDVYVKRWDDWGTDYFAGMILNSWKKRGHKTATPERMVAGNYTVEPAVIDGRPCYIVREHGYLVAQVDSIEELADIVPLDLLKTSARADNIYGKDDLDALFPDGALLTMCPWPQAYRTKAGMYDKETVRKALSDPNRDAHMAEFDPRQLKAIQPSVTRQGVAYYLSDQYRQTGVTFADHGNPGNKTPVVYIRGSEQILLAGHHRAAAALLKGEPLHALRIEAPSVTASASNGVGHPVAVRRRASEPVPDREGDDRGRGADGDRLGRHRRAATGVGRRGTAGARALRGGRDRADGPDGLTALGSGDLPEGIVYKRTEGNGWRSVDAHLGPVDIIGTIMWATNDDAGVDIGEIEHVEVHERYRRRGIASALLTQAREWDPRVHHSTNLTADGRGWSSKVAGPAGGRIPAGVKARPPFGSDIYKPRPVHIGRKAGEDIADLEPDEREMVLAALKRLERGTDRTIEAKRRPPLIGCFSLDVTGSMRVMFFLHTAGHWEVFAVSPDHNYDEIERRMRNVAGLTCPMGHAAQMDPDNGLQHLDGSVAEDCDEVAGFPVVAGREWAQKVASSRTIRFFHGTSSVLAEAIKQSQTFRPIPPKEISDWVAEQAGIDPQALWMSNSNYFSRSSRDGDPKTYLTTFEKVASEYAKIGSEVLNDCLYGAARIIVGESDGPGLAPANDLTRARDEWVAKFKRDNDIRPVVLMLDIPVDWLAENTYISEWKDERGPLRGDALADRLEQHFERSHRTQDTDTWSMDRVPTRFIRQIKPVMAKKVAALETQEWIGRVGDRTHITCEQHGTIPTSLIADMPGVMGEVPGEHRNKHGQGWEDFKADVKVNGVLEPIFITVDYGQDPRISEGNHRRDAAVEVGLPEVPVEIRYFGHAERMSRVASKYTVFVGWGARTPDGPAGLTPDSHGRIVVVEADTDNEAILLAAQMVNGGEGTNPITALLPDGMVTSTEILSMEAAVSHRV